MAQNVVFQPHKSSLGINANLAMLIAYLGSAVVSCIPILKYIAFAVPIIVLVLEKESAYVKFHAAQSICLTLVGWVFSVILGILSSIAFASASLVLIGLVGIIGIVTTIISIIVLVLEIICIVKGWKYECYKLPVIGGIAERIAHI